MAHKNKAAQALGSIRSKRKTLAAKKNGLKGGRPSRGLTASRRIIRSFISGIYQASGQCVRTKDMPSIIGCSVVYLLRYLERRFQPGMTWKNYGHGGWVVDHVRAKSQFNLSDPRQFLRCFSHKNCQPLWERDNHLKRISRREYIRKFKHPARNSI